MRRGREFYSKNYGEVMSLHDKGLSPKEIADKLGISYSAVYHWTRGLRKPEQGNVAAFTEYLKKHGPTAVVDIKSTFPKHNELFLICCKRDIAVKRHMLRKKFGEYSTWYYLTGQESLLESRLTELMEKIKQVQQKLGSALK